MPFLGVVELLGLLLFDLLLSSGSVDYGKEVLEARAVFVGDDCVVRETVDAVLQILNRLLRLLILQQARDEALIGRQLLHLVSQVVLLYYVLGHGIPN